MENRKSRLYPRKKQTLPYKVIRVCITNRPVRSTTRNECPRDSLNEMPHKMCIRIGCSLFCSEHLTGSCGTAHTYSRFSSHSNTYFHPFGWKVLLLLLPLTLLIPDERKGVFSYHRINVKLPSSLRLLWLPLRFDASLAPSPWSLNENAECIRRRAKSEMLNYAEHTHIHHNPFSG